MFGFEILLALLMLALYLYRKRSQLKAPGPSPLLSLPFVGHGYLLGGGDMIKSLFEYRQKYGDVFRLDVGSLPTMFICGWTHINEALRSDALAGRPYGALAAIRHIHKVDSKAGPAASGKVVWQEQRKFMINHLNDLGQGSKETMEGIISQEADYLAERIRKVCKENKSVTFNRFFLTAINNVIWRIATGKTTKQDDPTMTELTSCVSKLFQALDPGSLMNLVQLSNMKILRFCQWLGLPNVLDMSAPFTLMLETEIADKVGDPSGDYIERMWAEVERNDKNTQSSFHGEDGFTHMFGQMFDFFVAGTDTVSTFLEWSVLYMCKYTELQDRLHAEIRECFGTDGTISLRDNFRLPLLEATVEEISRHCQMTALLVPHAAVSDVSMGGHLIPKGTQVFLFAQSVHMDPTFFDHPEEFRPERHLKDGGVFQKSDKIMFFGGHQGKRKCIGETLGRSESFLFLATLLQKFKFSRARNDQELDFTPKSGLIFYPKPFDVLVQERK